MCSTLLRSPATTTTTTPTIMPPNWFMLRSDIPTHYAFHHAVSIVQPDMPSTLQTMGEQFNSRHMRHQFTTFGYMPAPPAKYFSAAVKQIIGINGAYLKLTTSQTEIDFVWHDRVSEQFLFWGNRQNVINAMKIIRSRIIKYTAAAIQQIQQDDGECDDGECAECDFLGKDCKSHQDGPAYIN